MKTSLLKIFFFITLPLLVKASAIAQPLDTTTSDGLFQAARMAAFEKDDYPLAKRYLFRALEKSPDYADIRIFLGRIYTWTNNYDSGRIQFKRVLVTNPTYNDAYLAYTDLEYFSDNYAEALLVCRSGLKNNPVSEGLLLREAKILNKQGNIDEAEKSLEKLIRLNKHNTEALALLKSIRIRETENTATSSKAPALSDTNTSDALLIAARKSAFKENDYEKAKQELYHALQLSPGYADIKIFLGRIHTWTDNPDSARYYFTDVLKSDPGYEDASLALSDLEYWNNQNGKALQVITEALLYHPVSINLWVKKAKILNSMRRYADAQVAVDKAVTIDKNNSEARSLANRIKENSASNRISLTYDYVTFDKQFSQPWHLASFDYGVSTGIGTIIGRVNYANRFGENGVQYEIEAYPRISNTFYSYVNFGYSENVGVFPSLRGGFSLYANLPNSYEGELGVRYLKFSGDPTIIYTAALGKYYKSWLFTGRTYLTPGNFTNTLSATYNLSARYYFGTADDMIGGNLGYGISPDDRLNSIQLDNSIRLVSYRAGLLFKKKITRFSVLTLDASWVNQEYLPNTIGNQYQFSIGWLYRF